MRSFLVLFFILCSCAQKQTQTESKSYHTQKLIRPLDVKFISKDRVSIKMGSDKISDVNLQVFHTQGDSKTLLFDGAITDVKTKVDFALDESFSNEGGVLAAIVKGKDLNNEEVSSVDTYVLGEQEQINSVKKQMLKN